MGRFQTYQNSGAACALVYCRNERSSFSRHAGWHWQREREVITDGTVGVCLASGAEGTKVTHVLAGFIWEHSNKNLSSRVWTCVFVSKILMEALFARDTG